MFSFCQYIS